MGSAPQPSTSPSLSSVALRRASSSMRPGRFIRCRLPSVHTTLLFRKPTPLHPMNGTMRSTASGAGTVSSSITHIHPGEHSAALLMPSAKPPAPPVLVARRTVSMALLPPIDARYSAVPSVEWLSIMMVLRSGHVCPITAPTVSFSRARRL